MAHVHDANLVLQTATTKTTAFQGTALDLKTTPGTPIRGMVATVDISNYSAATAGAVWTPIVETSADNTTFVTSGTGTPLTTTTASQNGGEQQIPFSCRPGDRYVRLSTLLSPTTGTPTITYTGYLDTK